MPHPLFVCKRCGWCCTEIPGGYQNSMSAEEYEDMIENAPFSLNVEDWCVPIDDFGIVDYWISPATGSDVPRCPWYRFYKADRYKKKGAACLLQQAKPPICADFPATISVSVSSKKCQGFNHHSEETLRTALRVEVTQLLDNIQDKMKCLEYSKVSQCDHRH